MKVTSKQPQSQVGFEAYFKDGKMIDKATEKQIETPSKTAARDGTTISVENLFYNVPQRKQAYETTSSVKSEEQRIVKVVQLYALANAGKVGYSLTKKESSGSSSGLKNNENVFSVKKDENFQKRVCKFFGKDISQNLVEIEGENKGMYLNKFVMKFTNPNYSGQSMNFILFVNSLFNFFESFLKNSFRIPFKKQRDWLKTRQLRKKLMMHSQLFFQPRKNLLFTYHWKLILFKLMLMLLQPKTK